MAETRVRARTAVLGSADSAGKELTAQFNVVKLKLLSLILPLKRVSFKLFGLII